MKNKKLLLLSSLAAAILLVPIKLKSLINDTVIYKAALYSVNNYHSNNNHKNIEIYILGFKVYDTVEEPKELFIIDKPEDNLTKLNEGIVVFKLNTKTGMKESEIPVLKIKDEEGLGLFTNLINNATRIEDIPEMQPPRYIGVVSLYENPLKFTGNSYGSDTETIVFDINLAGGMYCKATDPNTWYSFEGNDVATFMKYLDRANKNYRISLLEGTLYE